MHTFFEWGGRIFCWNIFCVENFNGEEGFQGVNFLAEILYWGIGQNSHAKFFLCLAFSDSISHVEMLGIIVQVEFSPGLNCLEYIYMERRNIYVEVEPDFLILFKKRSKIK